MLNPLKKATVIKKIKSNTRSYFIWWVFLLNIYLYDSFQVSRIISSSWSNGLVLSDIWNIKKKNVKSVNVKHMAAEAKIN